MPRVVHFEISVDDVKRAEKFYTDAFNWKFSGWGGDQQVYWLIDTGGDGPGINGGMMKRPPGFPPTTNIIDVPNCDEAVARVQAAGGKIFHPKTAVPGIGWVAYATDTEGNLFGMMQADKGAK